MIIYHHIELEDISKLLELSLLVLYQLNTYIYKDSKPLVDFEV